MVDRGWLPTSVQDAGLKAVLQLAYMQYSLLHGSLRPMLVRLTWLLVCTLCTKSCQFLYAKHLRPSNDEVATSAVQAVDTEGVQAALQSVLNEAAARLLRSKSKDLAMLQSPLSMISGVSWLPLANHIFTG